MLLQLAGLAAYIIVTILFAGGMAYIAYAMGFNASTDKWSDAYNKLYRTAILELMKTHGASSEQLLRDKVPPPPANKTSTNVLKFNPKKGPKDETRH